VAARLEGQVGIVTGSASGIGRECAIALALEGASVVVADVDVEGAKTVSDHIIACGTPAAHAVQVDLGDPASVESLIQQTLDRFGRLDILHNNAAATHLAATRDLNVLDMDPEVWDATMRINLKGTMLATKFALPHMIAAGRGSIVNTSSGASLGGDWGHTAYGVSKAAINALTRYTATQYGKAGVRCNAIAPGLIVTPASADNYAGPNGEMMLRHMLTPRLGASSDIASMLVFLCSSDAGFVTGQIISVDGGAGSHLPHLADIQAQQTAMRRQADDTA
jgi:NAD(P)-dependent dehydrogenase (short-subunit alcohol dehydrogenase family)